MDFPQLDEMCLSQRKHHRAIYLLGETWRKYRSLDCQKALANTKRPVIDQPDLAF
jgi:hypothetical protein